MIYHVVHEVVGLDKILRFTVVGLPLLATDGVEHFSVPDPFDTVTTLSPVITRITRD